MKLRNFSRLAILVSLLFFVIPTLVHTVPAYASSKKATLPLSVSPNSSSVMYNNVNLPRPYWWGGTSGCDTNYSGSSQLGTAAFRGSPMCGPEPKNGASDLSYYLPIGWTNKTEVREWECPEAAMRYMYLAYGQHPYVAGGGTVVSNYPGNLMKQVTNAAGSGVAPQVGDVMSLNTSDPSGHVVIVSASSVDANGNGSVTVVDENGPSTGTASLGVSNWLVSGTNEGGTVTGWLHPQVLVSSPNPSTSWDQLNGVWEGASDDIYAVGYTDSYNTLILHWGGRDNANYDTYANQWIQEPNSTFTGRFNAVSGVPGVQNSTKANQSSDVWAVGDTGAFPGDQSIVYQYNGSSWAASTTNPPSEAVWYAVKVLSANNVWLAGQDVNGNGIVAHYTGGTTWNTTKFSLSGGAALYLNGLHATSSSNVWVVGGGAGQTYAAYWNGTSWATPSTNSALQPPNPLSGTNYLTGVYAFSTSAWAVGYSSNGTTTEGFVSKWNGSSWSTPKIMPGTQSSLYGITALSSTNLWIDGTYEDSNGWHTLVEQDTTGSSSAWTQIASDDTTYTQPTLAGITSSANGNIWTVGYGYSSSIPQTVTEFFD